MKQRLRRQRVGHIWIRFRPRVGHIRPKDLAGVIGKRRTPSGGENRSKS